MSAFRTVKREVFQDCIVSDLISGLVAANGAEYPLVHSMSLNFAIAYAS